MDGRPTVATAERVTFLCCQFCPYKTRFTGNLAKHIRTHTGERPFVCPFCGKSFASKSNYNTHIVIHTAPGRRLRYRPSVDRFPGFCGRLRQTNLTRPSDGASDTSVVRNIPVVKSLISSSRSSPRSSSSLMSQQLSPIGSFLMPQSMNAPGVFSHAAAAAFYSSVNFSSFAGGMMYKNGSYSSDSATALPSFAPLTDEFVDEDNADNDDRRTSTDYDEDDGVVSFVNHSDATNDKVLTIADEDVKPSIIDIINILQRNAVRHHSNRERRHEMREIKQEQFENGETEEQDEDCDATIRKGSVEPGRRRRRNGDFTASTSQSRMQNGVMVDRVPVSASDQSGDQSQLHTQMLIDTLIKESRLYRCEACNILFPDYSVYVLHRSCHGNESEYQCHFCQRSFDEKFSFLTHFIRCPHEEATDAR